MAPHQNGDSPARAFDLPPFGGLPPRRLLVLFGDQLCRSYPEHASLDHERDAILMMEVEDEATTPPSHRQRTVLFLSAMRHCAVDLAEAGYRVAYSRLDGEGATPTFGEEIVRRCRELEPEELVVLRPGDHRALAAAEQASEELDLNLEVLEDSHYLSTPAEFAEWAEGRKSLVLEHFYRAMRRRHDILVTPSGGPVGGRWNFDRDNRKRLAKDQIELPARLTFEPDAISREVMELVVDRFPDAPGRLDEFLWPVTPRQAQASLEDFVEHRLARFGDYQDAMLSDEPWLFHSLLSPSLNLKLLDPRDCLEAALRAFEEERAPLNAVEGFVRQILGWREFVRGVYWLEGPDYRDRNALEHSRRLPDFYWTGDTELECLRQALAPVIRHGYGHHIHRLMITGNFALTSGVDPRQVSDWYLGMYVDGVDWVTLPNVSGMALFADGGVLATKPYASGGAYIDRMSDYCSSCPYDPGERTGERACPFSTFYWDFLERQRERLEKVPRMQLSLRNLERIPKRERRAIEKQAEELRERFGIA